MDWSKAKTILIVALIITDLFLMGVYFFQHDEENGVTEEMLREALARKKIVLDIGLPAEAGPMARLEVAYDTVADREAAAALLALNDADAVGGAGEAEDYAAAALSFLRACGFDEEVRLQKVEMEETDRVTAVFENRIEGIPLEESYMRCIFEKGVLADFERRWLTPVEFSKKKLQPIPPAEALITFMGRLETEEEVHVTGMEIIYWLDDSGFDPSSAASATAFPAWKITYTDAAGEENIMRVDGRMR